MGIKEFIEEMNKKSRCDKIMELLKKEISEKEKEYIYGLFKAMTPSMQKAIVDIMKTVNGEEIGE